VRALQEHDIVESYLSEVCRRIRWKKARAVVSEELRNHISDQADAYINNGLDEQAAADRAVAEMGDPAETGALLDRVHRPKKDWPLLAMMILMVIAGLYGRGVSIGIFQLLMPDLHPSFVLRILISEFGPYIVALAAFFAAYYSDIRRIGWIPFALYIFLACFIPVLLKAAGTTNARVDYYLQYLLFLTPAVSAYLALYVRSGGYGGLAASLLLYIVPAAVALLIGSTAVGLVICASCLVMMIMAVLRGYYSVKKPVALAIVCLPFAAALLAFWRTIAVQFQLVLNQSADPFCNWGARLMLANTGLMHGLDPSYIMNSKIDYKYFPYFDDTNGLTYLIHRFGWFIFVLVLVLVLALAIFLIRLCLKQRSRLGFAVSTAVSATLLAQIVIYIAANLGFMLFAPLSLPLLSHGGILLILDVFLLGLLLSLIRTDDLAKDRLKANERAPTPKSGIT
jgi:hypothetical protein